MKVSIEETLVHSVNVALKAIDILQTKVEDLERTREVNRLSLKMDDLLSSKNTPSQYLLVNPQVGYVIYNTWQELWIASLVTIKEVEYKVVQYAVPTVTN